MSIPSTEDIRALHERHTPSPEALELVLTHCEIVWKIAEQVLAASPDGIDRDLVRAGCLLHDIGVYRLYDATGKADLTRYVRHGVLGHELLRAEGLPEEICRFCSCHVGMGLTRHDVLHRRLPLPAADYLPVTREEKLVMYADKFHSKTSPPRFVAAGTYAARVRRWGDDKAETFSGLRKTFGDPELTGLAAAYGHVLT